MNVKNAVSDSFIGYYKVLDVHRTYKQYHMWMELYANNQGVYNEYLNGKKSIKPSEEDIYWKFNKSAQRISIDYSNRGRKRGWAEFDGQISGTTNHFNLSGHWGNGRNGDIVMTRITKDELVCIKNQGAFRNGVCY